VVSLVNGRKANANKNCALIILKPIVRNIGMIVIWALHRDNVLIMDSSVKDTVQQIAQKLLLLMVNVITLMMAIASRNNVRTILEIHLNFVKNIKTRMDRNAHI